MLRRHVLRVLASFILYAVALTAISAAEWQVSTVAGTGLADDNGRQGTAKEMNIGQPFGVEIGPQSALYITEVKNHRIWRLDRTTSQLMVVAGCGEMGYSGDGGAATNATMNEPYEIRFDRVGNMYVVEMQNHVVRRIEAENGTITTIAGTGEAGYSGDGGPATAARLKVPHGIVLDDEERLYIADIGNHRIRRVDLKTGLIETIAGDGTTSPSQSGMNSRRSPLSGPRALAAQGDSLWVALREGHSVWQIHLPTFKLQHIGGKGTAGYTGDGGPALEATFHGPKGLAVDKSQNLFVVDSENDTIRMMDARTGIVTTIAGKGKSRQFAGDGGPAVLASFAQPHGICVADETTIYVADTMNHRVRLIKRKETN